MLDRYSHYFSIGLYYQPINMVINYIMRNAAGFVTKIYFHQTMNYTVLQGIWQNK